MKDLSNLTTVIFEGGGIAGLGEAGAWAKVDEILRLRGILPNTFGGTSAGAVIALILALGNGSHRLRQIIDSTPWEQFMPSRRGVIRDALAVLRRGAFSSLAYAETWLGDRVVEAGLPRTATLADLANRTGRRLVVLATDEARMVPAVFSPETTPDVPVARAVLASMAIPEVWPSVLIDGVPYCDGGVFHNLPLRPIASELPADAVLGIAIDYAREGAPEPYNPRGIVRARRLLAALRDQRIHHPSHLYPDRVIVVPRPTWARATAFDLTERQRAELWTAGVLAARDWLMRGEGA